MTPPIVSAVISNLDPSNACGPNGIPVIDLEKCAPELDFILSKQYNKCFTDAFFPAPWKSPFLVSVFKNSSTYQPSITFCQTIRGSNKL